MRATPEVTITINDKGAGGGSTGGGGGGGGGGPTPQGPTLPQPPSTPLVWYRGYDTDGYLNTLRADVAGVNPWTNLGTTGADIQQVNAPQQPIFHSVGASGKLNNLPAVTGNGSQYLAVSFGANIPQPLTYGLVFMVADASLTEVIFQGGSLGTNGAEILHIGPALWLNFGSFTGDTGLALQSGKWHMLTIEANGASTIARLDGVQAGPFDAGTNALGGAALFAQVGGSFKMTGGIAEVMIFSRAVQTAASLEPYFKDVFGAGFPQ